MGSPGVEAVRYLAPVHAGDSLTLRVEVVGARPSRSRPEIGLVVFRSQMINAQGVPALERALPRGFAGCLPRHRLANQPLYDAVDGLAACYEALGRPGDAAQLRRRAADWPGNPRSP